MDWSTILIPVVLVLLYFLHSNGYFYVKSKSAVTFMGDGKGMKDRMGFSFTRCNGWIYRVLKVKEDGVYRFDLDAKLSKGTVQFQVLNRQKLPLLTLNPDTTRGRVQLEKGQRYYVRMEFTHADGDCAASWEKE